MGFNSGFKGLIWIHLLKSNKNRRTNIHPMFKTSVLQKRQ